MYQYYLQYRMKLQILFEEKEYTHNLNSDVLNTNFFEFGTLLSWKENIDNAYRKIAKYKTSDPELYDKLDKRIRLCEKKLSHGSIKNATDMSRCSAAEDGRFSISLPANLKFTMTLIPTWQIYIAV